MFSFFKRHIQGLKVALFVQFTLTLSATTELMNRDATIFTSAANTNL